MSRMNTNWSYVQYKSISFAYSASSAQRSLINFSINSRMQLSYYSSSLQTTKDIICVYVFDATTPYSWGHLILQRRQQESKVHSFFSAAMFWFGGRGWVHWYVRGGASWPGCAKVYGNEVLLVRQQGNATYAQFRIDNGDRKYTQCNRIVTVPLQDGRFLQNIK